MASSDCRRSTSKSSRKASRHRENIFARNLALMRRADLIIANLTPFRGVSADPGTVFELGWFDGAGKPVYGYSNVAANLETRIAAAFAADRPMDRRAAKSPMTAWRSKDSGSATI